MEFRGYSTSGVFGLSRKLDICTRLLNIDWRFFPEYISWSCLDGVYTVDV